MKAAFYTLGCKVNQYDTQMMSEKFLSAGHTVVGFDDDADIYIINTCTVTQVSDKKSRNMISRVRRAHPNAVIAVCGCFSQVSPEQAAALSGVGIVLGTRNRADILYYVNEYLKTGRQIVDVQSSSDIADETISGFSEKTRAILKIEDGCRNFCSYCLIPFARGKIISKPPEQVVSEAAAVAKAGYKEVVLTGIHLSSYGADLQTVCLADAVKAVADVDGIERIRLGSLEPTVITSDFVEKIASVQKLCPSFHLSLQSGCDKTLKAMNRRYDCRQYENAVRLLRTYFKDCAVTTDVIVGFPGESDEDFKQSCDFIDKIGFAKVHIFPYSKRKGTRAAQMDNQILKSVKQQREKLLCEIEQKNRTEFMSRFVNKTVHVLAERCEGGVCSGFTENYIHVEFGGNSNLCNTVVTVRTTRMTDKGLVGEIN